jgi:hypothetical protein
VLLIIGLLDNDIGGKGTRTGNITHLVVVKHCFTAFVAGHVRYVDVVAVTVQADSTASERKTDAGSIIFANC